MPVSQSRQSIAPGRGIGLGVTEAIAQRIEIGPAQVALHLIVRNQRDVGTHNEMNQNHDGGRSLQVANGQGEHRVTENDGASDSQGERECQSMERDVRIEQSGYDDVLIVCRKLAGGRGEAELNCRMITSGTLAASIRARSGSVLSI